MKQEMCQNANKGLTLTNQNLQNDKNLIESVKKIQEDPNIFDHYL